MSFSKTFIQEKLIGTPGQIVSFDTDNNAVVTDLSSVSGKSVILNVTAPDNVSRVVVSNGVYSYEYNFRYLDYDSSDSDDFVTSDEEEFYVQDDNVHTFYLPMLGDWAVAAVKGGISTTTSIYVDHVGTYNVSLSYFNAYIPVTYPIGATCTCSNGIDIYYADNTDGSYTFTVDRASDWTINVYNPEISKTATQVVSVTTDGETVTPPGQDAWNVTYLKADLNENDWPTIRYTVSTGEADNIWNVGDIKEISLNGTFGNTTYSDFKVYAQIIEFNHNTAIESESKPTITFQLGVLKNPNASNVPVNVAFTETTYGTTSGSFVVNSTADNTTGWTNSELRSLLNTSFIECLPQELVEMLMEVTKYTSTSDSIVSTTDKIFIPSNIEINGTIISSNQLQYSYYQSNSKIRYEDVALTTACNWWLRTPYLTNNNATDFYTIAADGTISNANANYSYGIAPMFVIGG